METGQVMRTGPTGDLALRRMQHALDPTLKDFEFEPVYRTDNYAEQRGLEQELHWVNNPPKQDQPDQLREPQLAELPARCE